MKLKDINGLRDLEHYGISILTGERDNLLLGRLLCDLNEDGAKLLQEYFGLAHRSEFVFQSNWNRTVGEKQAIYSIMLTSNALWDIAVFALLQAGAKFVYRNDYNGILHFDNGAMWDAIDAGYAEAQESFRQYKLSVPETKKTESEWCKEKVGSHLQVWKRYKNHGANFQVHAMSGRD